MNRRQLLRQAAALPAILASSVGAQGDFWRQPRSIWLQRMTHLGREEVKAVYFADGRVVADGYLAACRLLRDVRAGQAVQMSVVLLDILCGIQGFLRAYGHSIPLLTTSGYRSPATNASIEGAVRSSMHIQGRAWDGRMQGVPADLLARIATYLQGGGVGLYQGRGFLHVDDGRLRFWRG
ncbi:YcbK family protein [Verminephrobacter eiseniae]|uniref:Murein endopeptidase K n=1 Tax=Verminephrobacter eiseniae (strain EF01-2) TaxID=391735 RepID=A1WP47_VEREI|nr:protein of unknown function DUF882 [Verminephrobacter eiseniae EF01-2]MCW5284929.1 DUF882 domain-containing protein [Verminephrobacter eiseniae]MCW5302637.1 DUF882 domain-containing protein [Verminephrobacter eiseniae]MCW8179477.1 DUF882 domain-containing protein [Verminephrobacter eiseniae]MCW8189034.1 DUF882 domain-containing protein [Verminephrobacter eiseniae]